MPSAKNKTKINEEFPLGPGTFAIEASNGRWRPYKHLIIVIEFLLYLVQGRFNRFMIFMPPRHGKSWLISKFFLTWFLGSFPDLRIILATHSATFSAKWGRITKQLLQEYGLKLFVENIKLNKDSSASYRWDIDGHEGGLLTTGIGGAILGEGANGLIIDDPTKGFKKAGSKNHQEELNDWFYTEAQTRLDKDLVEDKEPWVIYIAQRLNKKDLAGQILDGLNDEDEGEPQISAREALNILRNGGTIPNGTWVVLNLPALAEEEDLLGRQPGEALFPEKLDEDELKRLQKDMGSFRFNAIYQGNPQEREGKIFKRWWFKEDNGNLLPHLFITESELPDTINTLRYWDFAASGEDGDATAGLLTTFINDQLIILDLIHGKYSAKKVLEKFKSTAIKDGNSTIQMVEQEPGSSPKILVQRLKQEEELKGYSIRKDKVQKDKADRAFDLEALSEDSNVRIVKAWWNTRLIDQLIEFTGEDGGEDDIVDTCTGAARFWKKKKKPSFRVF